jgi:hypothetical protein
MRLKLLPRINGRRGAFQLLLGTVFGMLAIAMLSARDFSPTMQWLEAYLPSPTPLGVVWAVAAASAFIGAFLPRPKDWFSFAALTVAPALFGFLAAIGGLIEPMGTTPLAIIMYWALAGVVMVVSGMTGDRDRDYREVAL